MPVRFFTDAERERLDLFPEEVEHNDLVTFFTLSSSDKAEIPVYSAAHNRLGFVLQLGALRFMGFVPDDLASAPASVVHYIANQMNIEPGLFAEYGVRDHTRTDHLRRIAQYVGYRKADEKDLKDLSGWLRDRALEHDKPKLLYDLTCDKLRSEKILRPGVTRLERLVAEARQEARFETLRRLAPILTDGCRTLLDSLLTYDSSTGSTWLSWLRRSGISNSPRAILGNLERLAFLKDAGVSGWNLDNLNLNRLKLLAQIARRSTGQALQRSPAERRYPTLVHCGGNWLTVLDRCFR